MERFAFDEQIARMADKELSLRTDQGDCSNRPRALDLRGSGGYGGGMALWLVIGLAHKSSLTNDRPREPNALRLPNTTGAKETRQER